MAKKKIARSTKPTKEAANEAERLGSRILDEGARLAKLPGGPAVLSRLIAGFMALDPRVKAKLVDPTARDVDQSLEDVEARMLELVEDAAYGGKSHTFDSNLIGALGRIVTARRDLSRLTGEASEVAS